MTIFQIGFKNLIKKLNKLKNFLELAINSFMVFFTTLPVANPINTENYINYPYD